jgi:hypothetical protein
MRWKNSGAESQLERKIPVHLLTEVEKYLRISRIPAARFGREVMRDPRFVFDLRNGREPRDRTITRVRAFLKGVM